MTRAFVLALASVAIASVAHADPVAVGLFAPSAPFASTAARVELASRLGEQLGKSLGGTGSGRAYARAGDFAAAVKKGEITVAVVDATYLATAGGAYTIIATSVRGGETSVGWQLIARGGAAKIADLRGKKILVPSTGGREVDFALNVMLGGEVTRDYFAAVEAAPDTASTLAALGLGKADAAIVPGGVELPAGATRVLALPALSTPVLVAYGAVTPAQRDALASAAAAFKGDATIGGFRAAGDDGVRAIARRYTVPPKRGPFVVPAVRLLVGDLVEGRTFAIERTPATQYVAK